MTTQTTPEERMQRFRASLISQTEGLPLAQVIGKVQDLHADLLKSLDGLTPAQVAFKPAPEQWSIAEVLSHVCGSSANVREGLRLAQAGQTSPVNLRVAADSGAADPVALARRTSQEMEETLRSLPDDPSGKPVVNLGMLGELECKPCLAFLLYHVGDHAKQIAAVKAHPNFPSS